jgi:hypothetical protein
VSLFLLTGLFVATATPGAAQVQLPTMNLGDTNFEDGFGAPGWFLEEFPSGYTAGQLKDSNGKTVPGSNRVTAYSTTGHVAFVSKKRFLGGWLAGEVLLPLVDLDVQLASGTESRVRGFADLTVGAGLQWAPKKIGHGVFVQRAMTDVGVPTGKYSNTRPVNIGNHFIVVNPYYAFTYERKKVEFSARLHYLWNSANNDPFVGFGIKSTQPGQAFHINYATSYALFNNVRLGFNGYWLQQLTNHYFFRFAESNAGRDVFNRSLADKISDVRSPVYRLMLKTMATSHVVPRPYIWGFADTIRAGLEGRSFPITAFGRPYVKTAPRYFFPGVILLKLPIGLDLLVLIGLFFFFAHRLSPEWNVGLTMVLAASALFLLVLALGSTYAGIRHALPVVVLLAIIGGVAVHASVSSTSRSWKAVVMLALVAAAISALPVVRPWECFNEIVGSKNAYLYFSDEGVGLGQRGNELAEYYHRVLEPSGDVPFLGYEMEEAEKMAMHLDWLGHDLKRDESKLSSPVFSGTILADARYLGKKPFWDTPSLRNAVPSARFGNLMVLRGTFPSYLGSKFYFDALSKIYTEKPELEAAETLLRQSLASDPNAFFVDIELGNVCMKRGSRDCALQAYSDALQHAPDDSQLRGLIEAQIKRVSAEPLKRIPDLRDPFME